MNIRYVLITPYGKLAKFMAHVATDVTSTGRQPRHLSSIHSTVITAREHGCPTRVSFWKPLFAGRVHGCAQTSFDHPCRRPLNSGSGYRVLHVGHACSIWARVERRGQRKWKYMRGFSREWEFPNFSRARVHCAAAVVTSRLR